MSIQMAYKTLIDPEKEELRRNRVRKLEDLERNEKRKRRRKERKKADTSASRKRKVRPPPRRLRE